MKEYLKELYKKINETDDIYVKGYIWSVLSDFSKYCSNDEEIKKMFNDISMACQYIKSELQLDTSITTGKKDEFLSDNSELINSIPPFIYFYDSNLDKKKHSQEGLISFLESFLYSVSSDLLNFYKEMKNTCRIVILNKGKSNGYTGFSSIDNSECFICINKFETFDDLKVLIHEIGHAYYNYCNNITIKDTKCLDLTIKSEIPAMWLEMLFHIYSRRYYSAKIKKKRIKNFNDFMNYYGLYATSFLQMGSQDEKIEDMYKCIYETDYSDLINPIRNNKSLTK